MMQVEGYVQAIETVPTKTGKTMYNVRVNGDKFGAGMYPPKFKQGDFISFTCTMNGNFKNMETRTVTIKAAPPMPVQAPVASAGAAQSAGNWDTRQDTISKQAALNSAMEMVSILAGAGAVVGLDKAKTPADKAAVLTGLVTEFTKEFYHQNTGKTLDIPDAVPADQSYGEDEPKPNGGWE